MNNIAYFNELLKITDIENEDENDTDNIKICLISNTEIKENIITLECGHEFNYIPLYREVEYQKTKKILDNSSLRFNQIKCPYCRTITNKLLPYYKYYNVKRIRGVNHPAELCIKINECEFMIDKTKKCNDSACVTAHGCFCNRHFKYTYDEEQLLDNIAKSENKDLLIYQKKPMNLLKDILRKNKCKVGGKKQDLIDRILINKKDNSYWIENDELSAIIL